MTVETRLENGVFESLDKLGGFIAEHSLIFLVVLILLTLLGGLWLLAVLRKNRAASQMQPGTGLTLGFGILIGNRPSSREPPPPFTNSQPANWDDQRD
jgi:hypothetical protein